MSMGRKRWLCGLCRRRSTGEFGRGVAKEVRLGTACPSCSRPDDRDEVVHLFSVRTVARA